MVYDCFKNIKLIMIFLVVVAWGMFTFRILMTSNDAGMAFSAAPTSCAGSGGLGRHDRKFQPLMGNDGKEKNKSVILHCHVAKTVGGQLIVEDSAHLGRSWHRQLAVQPWGSREPAWSGWWSAVWAALVFWRCWECGLNSSPGPQRIKRGDGKSPN